MDPLSLLKIQYINRLLDNPNTQKNPLYERLKIIFEKLENNAPSHDAQLIAELKILEQHLIKGSQDLIRKVRRIISPETYILNMPTEIRKLFLRTPEVMRAARNTCWTFKKLSEEGMLEWLNSKKPIEDLGLSFRALVNLLTLHGDKLKYFETSMWKTKSLKLINLCPNLTHLLIDGEKGMTCNPWSGSFFTPVSIENEGAMALAEKLTQLSVLHLPGNNINSTGVKAITKNLKQLTVLNLRSNNIPAPEVIAIAVNLTLLTTLSLEKVGQAGFKAIIENLRELTDLNLQNSNIGDTEALAIAKNLKKLTALYLDGNNIEEAGALAIAENLQQLNILNLSNSKIGDAGAIAIASNLTQLRKLNLYGNDIGDEGAKAIAGNLQKLRTLDLGRNNIKEDGALAIVEHLPLLKKFFLVSNIIQDKDIFAKLVRIKAVHFSYKP